MKSNEFAKKLENLEKEADKIRKQYREQVIQENNEAALDELKGAKFYDVEITVKRTVLAPSKDDAVSLMTDVIGDNYDENFENDIVKVKTTEIKPEVFLKNRKLDLFSWIADDVLYEKFLCKGKEKDLVKMIISLQKGKK